MSLMEQHAKDEVTWQSIERAFERVAKVTQPTPVMTSEFFDQMCGTKLHFKCENFQITNSFKFRGATNAVVRLKELDPSRKFVVVTHSSGNHALGLSKVAAMHGIEARIVMPDSAPRVKRERTIANGATVVTSGSSIQERLAAVDEVRKEVKDAEVIPPSDHPFVMEGAATIGIEFLKQVGELDAVLICCSMGGQLAGVSKAVKSIKPSIKVYGAEPERANDMQKSVRSGKRVLLDGLPDTIADGLRMSVGVNTWPVIQQNVDDVICVSEDEIVRSMYMIMDRLKIVAEPSAAVPLACALSEEFRSIARDFKNVGVIISGGNVDIGKLPWVVSPEKYDMGGLLG